LRGEQSWLLEKPAASHVSSDSACSNGESRFDGGAKSKLQIEQSQSSKTSASKHMNSDSQHGGRNKSRVT
jgi:hypothetical protein